MRKIGFFSLVVVVMMLVAVTGAQAATWTVCPAGPPTCDFATIQGAINDPGTEDGDTITVAAGVYTENINVTKELTIKGHNAGDTFVRAANPALSVFYITSSDVTLSGFNVSGATGQDSATGGIEVGFWFFDWWDLANVTIQKCTVEKNAIGILLWRTSNARIMSNIVRNAVDNDLDVDGDGAGILVVSDGTYSSPNMLISKNTIYDNDYWGLLVSGAWPLWWGTSADFGGMQITNNSIFNNGALDSQVDGGGTGDYHWDGLGIYRSTGVITLTNNKILVAPGSPFGFWISNSPGVVGSGNKFYTKLKPAKLTGTSTPIPGY